MGFAGDGVAQWPPDVSSFEVEGHTAVFVIFTPRKSKYGSKFSVLLGHPVTSPLAFLGCHL